MPSPSRLYLDNAATSFPKPACVHEAMVRYATGCGAPPRGAYAEARAAAGILGTCRARLARLFGGESPDQIVFTLNTTDALNLAIKGAVAHRRREAPGRPVHVVTTALDHNSVLRPLAALEAAGQAEVTRVPVEAETGAAAAADVVAALRPDTCLVAVNHASNVTGAILDVAAIGAACRARGVIFLVDAAQSLGHCPLDVAEARIDLLAFPGHKGLLGPTGTGGLYIRPGIEDRLCTVREGGTGTRSEAEAHPQTMPDRFEPGSPNTVGIAGLSEAVGWMLERGIDGLRAHEAELTEALLEGLARLPGLRVPGPGARHRVGVVSMVHETLPALELATILETSFGILGRAGLHCAPLAHRALGTAPPGGGGAFRLSVGPFVSRADVNRAIEGVRAACGSAPTPPVAVARRPAPAGTIRR